MALILNVDYGYLADLNFECQARSSDVTWKQCQEYAALWITTKSTQDFPVFRPLLCPDCFLKRKLMPSPC
jgi:hypothetical protein